jgi:hypothetical protein
MGDEWTGNLQPDWGIIAVDKISEACNNVASKHPGWHFDLSALDLSGYLQGVHKNKRWWITDAPVAEEPADGEL